MIDFLSPFTNRETSSLSSPSAWLSEIFAPTSKAGVKVTAESAMQHTSVYVCVNVLSESVASLPVSVYKRYEKGGKPHKEKAYAHNVHAILHDEPNEEMTAFSFKQVVMLHLLLRGKSFAQIIRNKAGQVVWVYPLSADNMEVVRLESGKLGYLYKHNKLGKVPLMASEVLHFIGMSLDGITGLSPIEYNRHTIGLSVAMEEFGSTYFKNGANGGGVLQTEKSLSNDAFDRLKSDWSAKYAGLVNANKPIILEEGLSWEKLAISNEDSQFLQSRKFSKAEIASIYRVPLHMINEMDKATFANIEHQSIQFVIDAIRPWVIRMEQELKRKLFTAAEKKNHDIKFNLGALLRGDTKSRYDAYESATTKACWMTRNEVRELEDLNPIDGLDDLLLPLNMAKEGSDAKE